MRANVTLKPENKPSRLKVGCHYLEMIYIFFSQLALKRFSFLAYTTAKFFQLFSSLVSQLCVKNKYWDNI